MKNTFFYLAFSGALALLLSACSGKDSLSEQEILTYTAKGDTISHIAFKALSTRLQKAIQDSGVVYAVEYCNLVALPVTDSVSSLSGATIRRTTLQWRNEQNKPTAEELEILHTYEKKVKAGDELQAGVQLTADNKILYTAPIMVMPLCINCHGTPGKDIADDVLAKLREKYPSDKATGYNIGDWRGMWSITMERGN